MTIQPRRAAIAALTLCAGAITFGVAEARTLTYAMGYPPKSIGANAGEAYAKRLEELSGGDLKARVFPMSLLSFKETSAGVRDGMADSGFLLISYFPSEFPYTNLITELTMVDELQGVPDSHVGPAYVGAMSEYVFHHCDGCQKEMADQNQVFNGSMSTPPYALLCTKPIATEEQLKGARLRSAGALWARWAETMNATPVTLSISDAYEGLSQGVIDCTMSSTVELDIFNLREVVKDVTVGVPGGMYAAVGVNNVNKSVWKSLSEEERSQVLKASTVISAKGSWDYQLGAAKEVRDASDNGITVHQPSEALVAATRAFVRKDVDTIVKNYVERHNIDNAQEMVDEFRPLLAKWVKLVDGVDNAEALADLYWRETFSKVDVSTYGL
ncbi:C4-dicarboxylate TRAP transporter substrate-binding protein [Alloalcanivorax xenomutans]|uniref:C4-dicarboxylate TRAP transporter substrate-binding protein n=1 Tax=Alloalcanivorax xenomutans TaxID=1094342 RepID=UPI0004B61D8F|nr:C4-dicarboxylate TRAP transporter substrate-binding protein [Alloalcanivorax xenomutans]KYZ85527.1 hypothetical protein A3Q32_04760 [Alcanivorax sp. KX64203]WOA31219.1 C4-dicarboxylate TRAP transporter substrate-binding protein [Alloalcanivorax xenomutans]SOB95832.1 TRAP-type C4-dicarboxylate transport system substrate-binding protein [Alloalcanivorax xenomutans]